jgi:D-alanine transaminase
MTRTVFVNGSFVPEDQATVSIFDRGFLMGDAIYEVTTVIDGKLIEFPAHMARLARSLAEIEMPFEVDEDALLAMHHELIARNELDQGMIYMQVSRGPADRDFVYPADPKPTLIAFTQSIPWLSMPFIETGFKVVSCPDKRWGRRDIKTVQILWTCMSKVDAQRKGADDVWFVEDGLVTEGSSCNAFIIKNNRIITRALSHDILHGVTRAVILKFAKEQGLEVEERGFSIEEAQQADEAFVTASPLFATGVVELDGVTIGSGKPGPMTMQLREAHIRESLKDGL